MHDVGAVVAAVVAVVMGESQQGPVAQQPVVDGPRVDPDSHQIGVLSGRLGEAVAHVAEQPGHVPVHRGALAVP